jgi:hypothetical protein
MGLGIYFLVRKLMEWRMAHIFIHHFIGRVLIVESRISYMAELSHSANFALTQFSEVAPSPEPCYIGL